MHKFILAGAMLAVTLVQFGCIVPIYSTSQDDRVRELLNVSESMRQIPEIWERVWNLDMPDTATPYRTTGGVI